MVEPLTRRNLEGELYQRAPDVERQIRECVGLDPDQLRRRLAIGDQRSEGYVKEEALVHLIRAAYRAGMTTAVDDMVEALLGRCSKLVRKHLGTLGAEAVQEGSAEVAARLVEVMLDGDRGDFLQVRFWPALQKIVIRVFDRQLRERKHVGDCVPFSSIAGYERDESEAQVVQGGEDPPSTASDEEFVVTNDQVRDALMRVKEPHRTAFLLRYYARWPVEDKDPTVATISRKFGVDPRTIRNWLKSAEDTLRRWRKEQEA